MSQEGSPGRAVGLALEQHGEEVGREVTLLQGRALQVQLRGGCRGECTDQTSEEKVVTIIVDTCMLPNN